MNNKCNKFFVLNILSSHIITLFLRIHCIHKIYILFFRLNSSANLVAHKVPLNSSNAMEIINKYPFHPFCYFIIFCCSAMLDGVRKTSFFFLFFFKLKHLSIGSTTLNNVSSNWFIISIQPAWSSRLLKFGRNKWRATLRYSQVKLYIMIIQCIIRDVDVSQLIFS